MFCFRTKKGYILNHHRLKSIIIDEFKYFSEVYMEIHNAYEKVYGGE